ncbi:MAG: hypothetical protein QM660_11790 [Dysgonomonas sp.]
MENKDKNLKELNALKRKNRRQCAVLLLTALQVSSVLVAYYLGRSHK